MARKMLRGPLLALLLTTAPASAVELDLPIACTPGTDCFIQQYVDLDPGPGVRDYMCGGETYDGHDGTDIRLRNTADVDKGVAVMAAAPGVVMGLRDGVADHLVRTEEDRAAVAKIECGNGVRIDHGEGWHTQYCHMRQGSIAVKKGDKVDVGTKLGEVGYSGDATFPHVHLAVSKDMQPVDPFLPAKDAQCGEATRMLWTDAAKAKLAYQPGVLLGLGLANGPVNLEDLETGAAMPAPKTDTPVVAYVWAINLQGGDEVEVALMQAGAVVEKNAETLDRNKAQYMLFVGKKAPEGGWPKGSYHAEVKVMRDGKLALEAKSAPVGLE